MSTTFKQAQKPKVSRICKDVMGATALVIVLGACQSALDKPVSSDAAAVPGQSRNDPAGKTVPETSLVTNPARAGAPNSTETPSVNDPAIVTGSEREQVVVPVTTKMVIFTGGTNSIPGAAHEQELRNFVGRLGIWQSIEQIKVIGHTDSTGSLADNERLSIARAQTVADRLQLMGLKSENYQVIGEGELNPLGDNRTRAGRAKNRRIEIEAQGFELKTVTQMAAKTEPKAK